MEKRGIDIQNVKHSLLGMSNRIVKFSYDGVSRNYHVRYGDRHAKVVDTRSGKILCDNAIKEIPSTQQRVCIIHRLSEDIQIVGIFDDERPQDGYNCDEKWQFNYGMIEWLVLMRRVKDEGEYNYLFLYKDNKIYYISQYYMREDVLTVDVMVDVPSLTETDTDEEYTPAVFRRWVIQISTGKLLHQSELYKYEYLVEKYNQYDYSRAQTDIEVPGTVWYDDGLLILPEKQLWKAIEREGLQNCHTLIGHIHLCTPQGKLRYSGPAKIKVGRDRLFYMVYENSSYSPQYLEVTRINSKGRETEIIYKSYPPAKAGAKT